MMELHLMRFRRKSTLLVVRTCVVAWLASCGGESQSNASGSRGGSGGEARGGSTGARAGAPARSGSDQGGTSAASVALPELCERPTTAMAEAASRYLGCVEVAKEARCRAEAISDSADGRLVHGATAAQARYLASGVQVSSDELMACADALVEAACADTLGGALLDACLPKAGELELGQACVYDEQCASLFCKRAAFAECGTCADLVEPCQGVEDCPERLSCDPNGVACIRLPLVGQPCVNRSCGGASYCEDGGCVAYPALGERCTPARGCGTEASCENGICVKYSNPMAAAPVADGASCNGNIGMVDVVTPTCLNGSRCVEDSSLPPITGSATGAPYSVPARVCRIVDAARCD